MGRVRMGKTRDKIFTDTQKLAASSTNTDRKNTDDIKHDDGLNNAICVMNPLGDF